MEVDPAPLRTQHLVDEIGFCPAQRSDTVSSFEEPDDKFGAQSTTAAAYERHFSGTDVGFGRVRFFTWIRRHLRNVLSCFGVVYH